MLLNCHTSECGWWPHFSTVICVARLQQACADRGDNGEGNTPINTPEHVVRLPLASGLCLTLARTHSIRNE